MYERSCLYPLMKQKLKKLFSNAYHFSTTISMTFLLTLNLFFIVALIASCAALTAWIFIKRRMIPKYFWLYPSSWLIMTYAVCIVLAISIVLMINLIILRPMRQMINATKQLASGDFSVRMPRQKRIEPRELREFAGAFNTAAEELSSTEILRKDFIHNFSHEFKTPIVSMNGFANLLLEDDLSEEDRREYLTVIRDESNRLAELSSNILSFSRIESQSILADTECEAFRIDEQLRQSILITQQKWSAKHLDFSAEMQDCIYKGCRTMLSEVWINLLDNAAKFSDSGGRISVILHAEATDKHERIIISIIDHGPGMDENTRKHIFEQFYQGDTSHAAEGNGLGLAMVKKILSLHHSDITVSSEPGHGSCFTVTLTS